MKCQMIAITAMSENIEDARYRPGVVGRLLDKTMTFTLNRVGQLEKERGMLANGFD
jgi:hypothetical protein